MTTESGNIGVELITLVQSNFRLCGAFASQYLSDESSEMPEARFGFSIKDELFQEQDGEVLVQMLGVDVTFVDGSGAPIDDDERRPFELSVTLAGRFRIPRDSDPAQAEAIKSTACAIVFPYLREHVSNLTMRSVYPTLRMPPMNVVELRRRVVESGGSEEGSGIEGGNGHTAE